LLSFFKKFFLDPKKNPKHIAVIMDGNGRWAKKRNMPRSFGHAKGLSSVQKIIKYSIDYKIDALTLYAFSTENSKISIRNVRRDANDALKKKLKDKEISEDDERRAQDEVQKMTDQYISEIDKAVASKEKDLLAI